MRFAVAGGALAIYQLGDDVPRIAPGAWVAESAADWQTPPEGWLPTRYEQKGVAAGRKQTYLIYKRLNRA